MSDDLISIVVMCFAGFVASLGSTTIGSGGALLLLSIASTLPINLAIPIHAVVSLFGNMTRWAFLHEFIDYKVVLSFGVGSVIGILLAAPLVNQLPPWSWQVLLGSFLLLSTWWKPQQLNATGKIYPYLCGLVASFMSVFVGATKPFIAALLGQRLHDYKTVIGTTNACGALPHAGKIILFASMGVALLDHWWLILCLIGASLVGVICGRHILIRDSGNRLRILLKIFATGLGINLILMGFDLTPWS